jgi:hypothetical protein
MNFREIVEASGYIAKNSKEAQDPRWSTSLTADVHTDTMRKQLDAFYPTPAPADGQVQIKEAKTMENTKLNEGMGSINVETQLDLSRIRTLAGLKNAGTSAGVPVTEEDLDPAEYDQEGEMARQDLFTAADAATELRSILTSNENLPEWVQAKITKAVDYLDTARDYMKAKEHSDENQ